MKGWCTVDTGMIVKPNVSSVDPTSERNRKRANAGNVRLCYPYWQYANLFIFQFVNHAAIVGQNNILKKRTEPRQNLSFLNSDIVLNFKIDSIRRSEDRICNSPLVGLQ